MGLTAEDMGARGRIQGQEDGVPGLDLSSKWADQQQPKDALTLPKDHGHTVGRLGLGRLPAWKGLEVTWKVLQREWGFQCIRAIYSEKLKGRTRSRVEVTGSLGHIIKDNPDVQSRYTRESSELPSPEVARETRSG